MNDWIHQSLGVFVVITPFSFLSCRASREEILYFWSQTLASPMKEPILVDIMIGKCLGTFTISNLDSQQRHNCTAPRSWSPTKHGHYANLIITTLQQTLGASITDIFSCKCILMEMCFGEFIAKNETDMRLNVLHWRRLERFSRV